MLCVILLVYYLYSFLFLETDLSAVLEGVSTQRIRKTEQKHIYVERIKEIVLFILRKQKQGGL